MKFNLDTSKTDTIANAGDLGLLGSIGDVAFSPVRGVAGAVEGVYDLLDFVAFDYLPDAEDNFGLGHSQTMVGGLTEGISQFLVGFVPGLKVASTLGKVGKAASLSSRVGKSVKAAEAAGKLKKASAINWGAQFGKSVVAGGIADFTVFDAQEQRLSNLLQAYPSLQNPVSEFLAADENDTEMEGRLKNFLEGGILGGAMEPLILGFKALRRARRARQDGGDPDKAIETVLNRQQAAGDKPVTLLQPTDAVEPIRVASWFSGMGTMELGVTRGTRSLMAIEIEPKIMDQFNIVHGTDYTARSVFDVVPSEMRAAIDNGADVFHCSPVCVNLSAAKKGRGVKDADIAQARKIAEGIREGRPPSFSLENVPLYRNTEMFDIVTRELEEGGYRWDANVIEASNYGGIQRRERLIIRATRVGELPDLPTPKGGGDWWVALRGMLEAAPDAPKARGTKYDSGIPNWEMERLQGMFERGELDPSLPIITMGGSADKLRAYAVNSGGPAPTLKASEKEVVRVIMPDGSVKRVDGPMMTRLMGLPEGVQLPTKPGEQKLMLGNGMEAEVTRNFIQPLAAKVREVRTANGMPDGPLFKPSDDAVDLPLTDPRGRNVADADVAKGTDAVKNRINREMGEGRLSRENGEWAVGFVNRISSRLQNFGLRFRRLENAAGMYDFATTVATIATKIGKGDNFRQTFAHELWHHLSRSLDPKEIKAINRDFVKQRTAFLKKHGLTEADIRTANNQVIVSPAARKVFADKGLKISDWYRMSNLDEWVAESMADATLRRIDLEDASVSVLGFLKYVANDLLVTAKSVFGAGRYDRITREFLEGRYKGAPPEFRLPLGSVADANIEEFFTSKKGILKQAAEEGDEADLPFPDGAQTPKEGAAINLKYFSDRDGRARDFAARMNTADDAYQAQLAAVDEMSLEDVAALGRQQNADLIDSGVGGFRDFELEQFAVSGQMQEVVARQKFLRDYMQQFSDFTAGLAVKARGGDDRAKVEFLVARKRSEDVALVVKRNQEKIAQALAGQKAPGTDIQPFPERPMDIPATLADEMDEAFSKEVLEELGGGDITKGREIVDRQLAEYDRAVAVGGDMAGVRQLQERARYTHMLTEYWMNSILSGPVTHAVNMTSNFITTFYLPMEKAFGLAMTGQMAEAATTMKHYSYLMQHMSDAFEASKIAFRRENDPLDNMGKFEDRSGRALTGENLGRIGKRMGIQGAGEPESASTAALEWIGKTLNLPSRFLLAEDAFFKNLNYRASVKSNLTEQALKNPDLVKAGPEAIAKQIEDEFSRVIGDGQFYSYKNLRGKAEAAASTKIGVVDTVEKQRAHTAEVNKYMEENWDENLGELAKQSREYARETTYTQSLDRPDRGVAVKATAGIQKLINQFPMLRFVAPFVRTPTNLAAFYLDRAVGAPLALSQMGLKTSARRLGILTKEASQQMQRGGRSREELIGRTATGGLLMFTASTAFANGNLTGGGPSDLQTRKTWEATGWQPYSIKMGDRWVSYRRFDPFASFLGSVADLMESLNSTSDETEMSNIERVGAALVMTAARNVTSKTYLTGMTRVANVLNNPDRYGEAYMEQTAASMLPFSSFAGQTFGLDENQQEIRGLVDALRSKYGLTGKYGSDGTKIAPKRNMFGEPIKRSKPWPWYGSPFAYSDVEDDLVSEEIKSLGRGFGPPRTTRNGLDLTGYVNNRGQNFHDRWSELHGSVKIKGRKLKPAMERLMKSARYLAMPAEDFEGIESPRVAEVRKLINRYRAKALQETYREFPDAARDNQRMTRIKQLTKQGRDVSALLDF